MADFNPTHSNISALYATGGTIQFQEITISNNGDTKDIVLVNGAADQDVRRAALLELLHVLYEENNGPNGLDGNLQINAFKQADLATIAGAVESTYTSLLADGKFPVTANGSLDIGALAQLEATQRVMDNPVAPAPGPGQVATLAPNRVAAVTPTAPYEPTPVTPTPAAPAPDPTQQVAPTLQPAQTATVAPIPDPMNDILPGEPGSGLEAPADLASTPAPGAPLPTMLAQVVPGLTPPNPAPIPPAAEGGGEGDQEPEPTYPDTPPPNVLAPEPEPETLAVITMSELRDGKGAANAVESNGSIANGKGTEDVTFAEGIDDIESDDVTKITDIVVLHQIVNAHAEYNAGNIVDPNIKALQEQLTRIQGQEDRHFITEKNSAALQEAYYKQFDALNADGSISREDHAKMIADVATAAAKMGDNIVEIDEHNVADDVKAVNTAMADAARDKAKANEGIV